MKSRLPRPPMVNVPAHQRAYPQPVMPPAPLGPVLSGPPSVPTGMGPAMDLGPMVDMGRAPVVAGSRPVFKPHNQRRGFA
jgi:hypothetical protein